MKPHNRLIASRKDEEDAKIKTNSHQPEASNCFSAADEH